MAGFQYQYGDKPLEGYTIQRGIGRGGFGEVYYALSDSGREVALKAIQGYEQIELRGVGIDVRILPSEQAPAGQARRHGPDAGRAQQFLSEQRAVQFHVDATVQHRQ